MKTESLRNRKVQFAFGSAILALLVVGAISYRGIIASRESDQWVRHTHEVLESLQRLLFAMQAVESSYRGFILTGKESYLQSYSASILDAQQGETTIRNLTADNPEQRRLLPALERLAAQKIQFGERVIGLRRTTGLQAAADAIRSGPGQQIMEEFQGAVRGMRDAELRLLVLRDADVNRRLGQTKFILILGTVLGLSITAAAGWSVQRDNSRRGLAEEALRGSEEKYRMVLDGVQDYAIFMLDPRGQVASWNAGAERLKGYKADEIIGQSFSRFFLQKDIDQGKPEEELQIAAASGRSEAEHWRVRKNGSRFWANTVITAARDSSGRLLGFSEISRDISERKKAEEALRGSEERLRMAVEAGEMGTWFWDIQRDEITWSGKFRALFGLASDAKLTYKGIIDLIHPNDRQRVDQSVKNALELGLPYDTEYRVVWPDSSVHWIAAKGRARRSPEGVPVEMQGTVVDVTERKNAEKHLAQMEGRYRGLLEAAPDAMVVVNQGGEIVLLNVQAEKQFGYNRDELVGQKVKNIIPEGFAERLIADGNRTATEALAQQIGTGIELYGRRRDGSDFPIEIMLSPLESAEGILVTAAIRDISVRKDAEKHLVKTVGELARANRELMTGIAERQQVEAELSSSHAEAERLLSSISSILIGVDDQGRVTRWNAAAASTFAIPSEAALDHPFDDLGIRWHAHGVGEHLASIAALGKSLRLDDLEFRDAAGKDRSLGATIHPIRGEHGHHRGFVFLGVEISQRKQLQEQLRQAQKLEAIGQLAAGVAHEINTPTQYVGDNIRFLEESWKKVNPLLRLIGRLPPLAGGNALSPE